MNANMPYEIRQGLRMRGAAAAAGAAIGWMILAALAGWLLSAPMLALAEPYMAVRDGYKCSQCHVNKTGGGARTDYATIYLQTRLAAGSGPAVDASGARTSDAGQGRVGALTFGADLRAALTYTEMKQAAPTADFGRQSACESCHADKAVGGPYKGLPGGGKVAEAYVRFQPLPDVASIVYSVSAYPGTVTRDFYGLIESLPLNGYVKAGTFKLPNGLQNTWDTPFQHVTQGGYKGNIGFETVYATGVEIGFEPGPFSISLSATNPDDLANSPRDKRFFLSASATGSLGLIGVNYAVDPVSLSLTRTLTSGFLGVSLGRITALGQVDALEDRDSAAGTDNVQYAGLAELDLLLSRGHNLRYVLEARDPSASHPKDRVDRQSVIYEAFLTPYVQARLGYRMLNGPGAASIGTQMFAEGHFVF